MTHFVWLYYEKVCSCLDTADFWGIVNALLDRLTDDNVEVKIDALKSIDALVLKQGESLCKELYRKNILKLIEGVVIAVS